ncbi:GTPase IMAP family member 7-like [Sinocyclocheilus anshuiensis]|uniref:GTPase IMAP family member 7-like n=1 Tax=Sinocyclocheilus anshuiensis TaxID=1608454 RepID=UPI0007B98E07|nr:PREDICTED: GTPase IMAP family member 7-like [Sinocyclocheilus anshuiensis]
MGASVSSPDRKIVLGKTGDGKSSTGNTILRKTIFTPDASPNSVTVTSVRGERKVYGQKITVIDTPGVLDTDRDDETIKSEIVRSIINCAAGVDAFVIVLKVERYTRHEREIVNEIGKYCGEDAFKHAVVLFTYGEDLEGQTIEEFVQKSPQLQELVDKCGGRCHVIDSKHWRKCLHCPCSCGYKSNRIQVKNLLDTINEMVHENGRYNNEILQIVEEMMIREMMNTNEDTVSPNQQRERAERIVHDNLMMKLAGASIGALTGALSGIVGSVAIALTCLKEASTSELQGFQDSLQEELQDGKQQKKLILYLML